MRCNTKIYKKLDIRLLLFQIDRSKLQYYGHVAKIIPLFSRLLLFRGYFTSLLLLKYSQFVVLLVLPQHSNISHILQPTGSGGDFIKMVPSSSFILISLASFHENVEI
ncbi:Uncharacterised protein r2_g2762 [Pycnogonum litorale]